MMDRHEIEALANRPGAGSAVKALKEAGLWDEFAGLGPEREFTVYLDGTAHVAAMIVVRARCEAEARKKGISGADAAWQIEEVEDIRDVVIDRREGRE